MDNFLGQLLVVAGAWALVGSPLLVGGWYMARRGRS